MKRLLRITVLLLFSFCLSSGEAQELQHPRQAEAVEVANRWLDLCRAGDAERSWEMLAPLFKGNLTLPAWSEVISRSNTQLGRQSSRTLRRVVWYVDPKSAPLPGLYAAVEFDSEFEHAEKHFQYIILHSQSGEPFRVMRNESTLVLKRRGGT